MRRVNLAVMGELSDEKFISKINPLLRQESVARIFLARYTNNPLAGQPQIHYLTRGFLSSFHKRVYEVKVFFYFFFLGLFRRIHLYVSIYFIPNGIYLSILSKILRIPVFHILTGTDLLYVKKSQYWFRLLTGAYLIGVRGQVSKEELIRLEISPHKIYVLHNEFDLPSYQGSTAIEGRVNDLLLVAYLRRLKRVDLSFRVIEALSPTFPHLRFLIVGDGPERNNLENLAKQLKIDQHVTFVGHVADPLAYYRQSKILIMNSESEGLPMSIIEAMACGCIPVVCNANDVPTIIENGHSGFLLPFNAVTEYANVIKTLLENNHLFLKISNNAITAVEQMYEKDFSPQALDRTWDSILRGLPR